MFTPCTLQQNVWKPHSPPLNFFSGGAGGDTGPRFVSFNPPTQQPVVERDYSAQFQTGILYPRWLYSAIISRQRIWLRCICVEMSRKSWRWLFEKRFFSSINSRDAKHDTEMPNIMKYREVSRYGNISVVRMTRQWYFGQKKSNTPKMSSNFFTIGLSILERYLDAKYNQMLIF